MTTENLGYLLKLAIEDTQYYCDILTSDEEMFAHTKKEFVTNLSALVSLAVDLIHSPLFKPETKNA